METGTHKDGQKEVKGEASDAHTDVSVVGPEEEGDEDHHIEAGQCSDSLRSPAS